MSFVLSFMHLSGSVSIKGLDEMMIFLPARYEVECSSASGLMEVAEWQADTRAGNPTQGN